VSCRFFAGITCPAWGAWATTPVCRGLCAPSLKRSRHPAPTRSRRHILGSVVAPPRFVVQLHDATTLHFDFRLQSGEVLRSWAVPKGPSLDPGVRRLAVPVEDHSLAAGEFEGVHGGQRRGSGTVIIWDEGTADIVRDEPGHLSFILHGRKLSGGFALTRTGPKRWILVKVRDEAARAGSDIVAEHPASVRSGKTWRQLRDESKITSRLALSGCAPIP
jgi:DNA ligase D-like protein (predicted 3'-phosphoesterase)